MRLACWCKKDGYVAWAALGGCLVGLVRISHSGQADRCVITFALAFGSCERQRAVAIISLNTTTMICETTDMVTDQPVRHSHWRIAGSLTFSRGGCVLPCFLSPVPVALDLVTSFNSCFFLALLASRPAGNRHDIDHFRQFCWSRNDRIRVVKPAPKIEQTECTWHVNLPTFRLLSSAKPCDWFSTYALLYVVLNPA